VLIGYLAGEALFTLWLLAKGRNAALKA